MLVGRAAANGRSLQREIVWMLFREVPSVSAVEGTVGVRPDRPSAGSGLGDTRAAVRPPFPVSGRSFRPDPKGGSGK